MGGRLVEVCFERLLREKGFLWDAGLVKEKSVTSISELSGR
jgi:hypothetical protein